MALVQYPCKDCQKRYVGCHSTCPDYLEARAKDAKMREELFRENQKQSDAISLVSETIERIKKRKHKRR